MKRTFFLFVVLFFKINLILAQGPHGSISIDISNFKEGIDTIYSREYAMGNNITVIKWKSKDFQI